MPSTPPSVRLSANCVARVLLVSIVALALIGVAGCAARQAFDRASSAAQANEWDLAVQEYRKALQLEPENPQYRIALVRAMASASQHYAEQGRIAEARGQLEMALGAYRRANEFDPSNRQLAAKVSDLEKQIRAQVETQRPPTNIDQLREAARQAGPPPLIRFNEVLPAFQFNTTVREILNAIGQMAGVNVAFAPDYNEPRQQGYAVQMDGFTLEQALNTVVSANRLFYTVLTPNAIMVANDNAQNRILYEPQLIKVLRLSNADATEVAQTLSLVVRSASQNITNLVQIQGNKTQNTITFRAPSSMAAIIERVVGMLDKPRAEVIVDVEILEVNRRRVQQYGLDLGDYAIGVVFSPQIDPIGGGEFGPQPFNLTAVRGGIQTSDFYLAVPAATIRFLETDSETKILAKPQLRGAEGQELRLELGEEVPIPTTVFQPLAAGGANVNPLASFNYRAVGVILQMTPRVTYDDNIVLDMVVENSIRTGDTTIAGTTAPTFAIRRVNATLRLRDGESNLLAGLVQEAERKSLRGIPGILRLPIIKQLFSANDNTIDQTDVIVLLTPRIVRSHELKAQDLEAIFIGTGGSLGLGGPAPLISQPPAGPQQGAVPAPPAPGGPPPAAPTVPPAAGVPVPAPAPGAGAPAPGPAPGAVATPAPTDLPLVGNDVQIRLMPGATDVRVGQGALAVPIAVAGTRLSSVTLTMTYNPSTLRVRAVQQSSFMSSAGGPVAFTEDHANPGRIDIVILRTGDTTGANGTGTLGVVLFDAIAPGPANLGITGTATAPGGTSLPMQFVPAPVVTVK
jgi:general secretion pathway protein D